MIFSLEVRRARKGDCLLLHWGSNDEPGLIVIDGGPASVYRRHLAPRLEAIRQARRLDEAEALPVELMMVSHVDDDHIHGILDLTDELVGAKSEQRPPLVAVMGCWHNTFDDIIGDTPEEIRAAVTAGFGAAALGGEVPDDERIGHDAGKVLAGIAQGHRLRDDLRRLGIPLNPQFGGRLIVAGGAPATLEPDLRLITVGPMGHELRALQEKHDAWLKKQGLDRRSPEAALAAFSDPSVTNLSSIVALVEVGGKRILLTGDARGDKILEGLEHAGLLCKDAALHVDILKVPHHGSANNMEPGFFRKVTADHYVFSGNGEHGNPERETLAMLLDARPGVPFTIHLTYPVAEIDAERERDWIKHRKKGQRTRDWSAAEDSLAALIASRDLERNGQRILCVGCAAPHVIDLLDPLGY